MKNNLILSEQIREKFSSIEGIQHIETNPMTGSVLFYYDRKQITSSLSLNSILNAFIELFPDMDSDPLKDWLMHL